MIEYVSYEQFGAIGDGKSDDMPAIVKAHDYANENKLPVKAKDGATYYIGGKDLTAKIKTSVDFGKAKFIIDDTVLENIRGSCFNVESDFESYTPDIKSIKKGQKKVDFPHEGNTYVRVFSERKKIFIRKGLNQNNGTNINDCFTVNPDGDVTVDIDRDISEITKAFAKRTDDEPITIKGGTFITIANQWKSEYKYHSRNFNVTRSNVTLEGVVHNIEGEGETGAPYAGFFTISEAVNVTVRNCLFTPHKTYYTASAQDPNKPVGMGTYELSLGASINVRLEGIRQTIDINNSRYWGLMGSNFCKRVYLDDCIMSRFDAHMGVTEVEIRRCEFGHQRLSLIGYGDFYIENSRVNGYSFISLRPDYGSFWDGRIIIKNCVWNALNAANPSMINAVNTGDHDFGYTCYMPREIIIDGLKIEDENTADESTLYILPNYDKSYSPDKPYKYVTTKKISIMGLETKKITDWKLAEHTEEYPDIEVEK